MAAPLLVLALEFHRAPLRFRHLTDLQRPLPEAFGDWLTESSAALAPAHIQATANALGTSPQTLRDAYLFFLRQVLLLPQADHYRILGLTRNCSSESIKQHHGLLVRLFHPDRLQEDGERSGALTARINHAHQVLRDPQARRLYDRHLPPLWGGEGSNGDAVDFFRPHGRLVPVDRQARTPSALRSRAPWVLFWTLGCVGMMTLLYALVREPRQPLLRVNPDLAGDTALGPSYMQVGAVSGHSTEAPGQDSLEPSTRSSDGTSAPVNAVARADARDGSDAAKPGRAADGSAVAESKRARQAEHAAAPRQTPRPELARTAETAKMPDPVARETAPAVRRSPPQGASGVGGPEEANPTQGVRERPREGLPSPPAAGQGWKQRASGPRRSLSDVWSDPSQRVILPVWSTSLPPMPSSTVASVPRAFARPTGNSSGKAVSAE